MRERQEHASSRAEFTHRATAESSAVRIVVTSVLRAWNENLEFARAPLRLLDPSRRRCELRDRARIAMLGRVTTARIDKQALVTALLAKLEAELANMTKAANTAREAATHEEAKPENDKDTRALEASYLAAGQAERVRDLEAAL